MRSPFIFNIDEVAIERAHGGSGSRQVLVSKDDDVSPYMEAMTKGFLPAGAVWDWQTHSGIDEFFLALRGQGTIEFRGAPQIDFVADDLVYIPAEVEHRILNTGAEVAEFYFVRLAS